MPGDDGSPDDADTRNLPTEQDYMDDPAIDGQIKSMDSYLAEEFDSMFETPDGAYKPDIFGTYEPKGKTIEDSADYTDDPEVLAGMFSDQELVIALRDAVLPFDFEDAPGRGALEFSDGPEFVSAEALYWAIDKKSGKGDMSLAVIYDTGLGSDRETTNADRIAMFEEDAKIDPLGGDEITMPTTRDAEVLKAVDRNKEIGKPTKAQVAADLMLNHKEQNQSIIDIADDLIAKQDDGLGYDSFNLQDTLVQYLPWSVSSDSDEREAFSALWGMMMSLDGGASIEEITPESLADPEAFRTIIYNSLLDIHGGDNDIATDSYNELIDNFGGLPEFVTGKESIASGKDDLSSGTTAAAFYRLVSTSAKPNEKSIYRLVNVKNNDPLLEKYTTEGSLFGIDARSFTSTNIADGSLASGLFIPSDADESRVIFEIAPGETKSIDASTISWFVGENEHFSFGNFEVVSVKKQKGRLKNDEYIVKIRSTDTKDVAAPIAEGISYSGIEDWKKVGGQMGSNVGGTYEDKNGNQYYVKIPKSPSHAQNESLASALYREAGIEAVEVSLGFSNGELRTISPLIPNSSTDLQTKLDDAEYMKKLQEGFAVDAWLANWDVAGLSYDNVITDSNGDPVRVDPGGALMWRAQGAPKGKMFGDKVNEIDSLRDPDLNPTSAEVFGSMTDEDISNSAAKLVGVTPERIDSIVDSIVTDPNEAATLKERLKKRRDDLLKRFAPKDNILNENTPLTIEEDPNAPQAPSDPNDTAAMSNYKDALADYEVNKAVSDVWDCPPEGLTAAGDKTCTTPSVDELIDNVNSKADAVGVADNSATAEEIIDDVMDFAKQVQDEQLKPSTKKRIKEIAEELAAIRKGLKDGSITNDQAIAQLNTLSDSIPVGGSSEDATTLEVIGESVDDYRRILDGSFENRPFSPTYPPAGSGSKGYAKDKVTFLTIGKRVRNKWGYAGTVDRYDKNSWQVWVTMDIDPSGQFAPGYKKMSFSTKTLDVIPEGGDDSPWIDLPGTPEGKKPKTGVTPTKLPPKGSPGEKYSKEIANKIAKSGKAAKPPKAKAPSGAPEVTESPIIAVEESEVNAVDIVPEWQTMPPPKSSAATVLQIQALYEKEKFGIDLPEVTDEDIIESAPLIEYVGSGYEFLNYRLRAGIIDEEAANIDKLMDKAPLLPEDTVLYRGVHNDYADALIDEKDVGDMFIDLGYSSTSLGESVSSKNIAKQFAKWGAGDDGSQVLLEIVAPKGTRGIYVPAYLGASAEHSENEFLLDRGTAFRVISKTKDSDGKTVAIRVAIVAQGLQYDDTAAEQKAPKAFELNKVDAVGSEISVPDGEQNSTASRIPDDDILVRLMTEGGSSDENVDFNDSWAESLSRYAVGDSPGDSSIKSMTDFLASLEQTFINVDDKEVLNRMLEEKIMFALPPDQDHDKEWYTVGAMAQLLHGIAGFTSGRFLSTDSKEEAKDVIKIMQDDKFAANGGGYMTSPAGTTSPKEKSIAEFWTNFAKILNDPSIIIDFKQENIDIVSGSAGMLLRALRVADPLEGTYTRVLHFMQDINDESHPLHYILSSKNKEIVLRPTSWMHNTENGNITTLDDGKDGLFQYGDFGKVDGALGDVLFTISNPRGLNAQPVPNDYGETEIILSGGRYRVIEIEKKEIDGKPYTRIALEDVTAEQKAPKAPEDLTNEIDTGTPKSKTPSTISKAEKATGKYEKENPGSKIYTDSRGGRLWFSVKKGKLGEKRVFIHSVFVDEKARRQGIAADLLDKLANDYFGSQISPGGLTKDGEPFWNWWSSSRGLAELSDPQFPNSRHLMTDEQLEAQSAGKNVDGSNFPYEVISKAPETPEAPKAPETSAAPTAKFIKNSDFTDILTAYYTTAKQAFRDGTLTKKDWNRIQSYVGSDSIAVNNFLRSGKRLWLANDKDTIEDVIKSIDDIFDVAGVELPGDAVVFRGIYNANKLFPDGVKPGDVFDDLGYSSTSIKSDVARTFTNTDETATVLAITVPSGTKMLANNTAIQAGQEKPEKEILLPRGLTFKVTSVTERTKPNKAYPFLPETYKEIAVEIVNTPKVSAPGPKAPETSAASEPTVTMKGKVTPTGMPKITVNEPLSFDYTAYEDIPSLRSAIASLSDENTAFAKLRGSSSLFDSGDVEDLEVRVEGIVDEQGNEKMRITYKLTSWAGDDLVKSMETEGEWDSQEWIEIPKTGVDTKTGAILIKNSANAQFKTNGTTYTANLGYAEVTLRVGSPHGGKTERGALHNFVTIDLPYNASDDDIKSAMAVGGITDVRPATTTDFTVLAENRLMSIFAGKTDASTNLKQPAAREKTLADIESAYDVTPADVFVTVGPGGQIETRIPDDVAQKIAQKTGAKYLIHSFSMDGILHMESANRGVAGKILEKPEIIELLASGVSDFLAGPRGGGLMSTRARWFNGVPTSGMSSDSDMGTGGGDYVFFTPKNSIGYVHSGGLGTYGLTEGELMFNAEKLYTRLDWYANYNDDYGRRRAERDVIENARTGAYEVMFKKRVGLESLQSLAVKKEVRDAVLTELDKRGIKEIHGRPVAEVVVVAGQPDDPTGDGAAYLKLSNTIGYLNIQGFSYDYMHKYLNNVFDADFVYPPSVLKVYAVAPNLERVLTIDEISGVYWYYNADGTRVKLEPSEVQSVIDNFVTDTGELKALLASTDKSLDPFKDAIQRFNSGELTAEEFVNTLVALQFSVHAWSALIDLNAYLKNNPTIWELFKKTMRGNK